MAGLMAPERFPIRKPTDSSMVNGRTANPPRYMEIGGFSGPGKWLKEGGGDPQAAQRYQFGVEKPTRVRGAKESTGMNVDTA